MLKSISKIKIWQAFTVYFCALLFFHYISNQIVLSKVSEEELLFKDFLVYNYLFNILTGTIKFIFISLILLVGSLISGIKVNFKSILITVILSNLVYFLKYFITFPWAYINWDSYTYETLKEIYHFSSFSLQLSKYDTLISQFLQKFNLYDLLFITTLIFFLKIFNKISRKQSAKIIFSSYVPALIIYALFLVFLTEL